LSHKILSVEKLRRRWKRRMTKGRRSVTIVFMCLLWSILVASATSGQEKDRPPTAAAPDEAAKTEPYELGEIVVTGKGEKRSGVEAIGTVRTVTEEDMENRASRTLDEVIELEPGLIIRTGAQGVPRVRLRGFTSRHVALLLNGIPFNSTFDGQFDPSLIPAENMARVKVTGGTASVLYGQGALGGAINIITKKGLEGFHGRFGGEIGERNTYLGRFNVSGGAEGFDFFASASLYEAEGFSLSDDFDSTTEEHGGLRENNDRKRRNLLANVGFAPAEEWRFGAVFHVTEGEYGIPPSTINDKKDIFANRPKYERVHDVEGYAGQFSVQYDIPGPTAWKGWFFVNDQYEEVNRFDDNHYNSMDDPSQKGTYHQEATTRILGGASQFRWDLGRAGSVTIGLSGERHDWIADGCIRDVPVTSGGGGGGGGGGGSTTYDVRCFDDDKHLAIYSTAIEYQVNPIDRLGLVLGYSRHWLKKEREGVEDASSYLAGAYFDILEGTRVRASFARKVRFPSIRQFYEEEAGNPRLHVEKSYNYEVGFEQILPGRSRIELTVFYIHAKDYIEKIPPEEIFRNNDKYLFRGFEIASETRFLDGFLLRTTYSFLDALDISRGSERDELQYRPRDKITVELKYEFPFGLGAYVAVERIAYQHYYSRKSPLQKEWLNNHTLVHAKLSQRLFDDRLYLYAGVSNLFDEDYEESYAFPDSGRFFYAGLEIRL
jgi:outer membrane cobalamin receptor